MKTIEKAAEEYAVRTGFHGDKETFIAGVKWAQRWIPVEEELPEIGERVLILENEGFENEYVGVDKIDKDGHWEYSYLPDQNSKITHWRPIELK